MIKINRLYIRKKLHSCNPSCGRYKSFDKSLSDQKMSSQFSLPPTLTIRVPKPSVSTAPLMARASASLSQQT